MLDDVISHNGEGELADVELVKAWLRSYAERRIDSPLNDERRAIPPHIILDFGNKGLLGMQVRRCDGGLGYSNAAFVAVLEQLAAIDSSLCVFVGLSNVLGIRPLDQFGSAATRGKWLKGLATGRHLGAFALTEPVAGSNPAAIRTTARLQGDRYVLDGEKHWIGNAPWSSVVYVFARTFDAHGDFVGVTGFVVDSASPGLEIGPEARTMGIRATVQSQVVLRSVEVPLGNVLGEVGGGLEVAQDAMMRGRLVMAAAAVGMMKRCAQLMFRYASQREIATGNLLDHPITRERITALTSQIEAIEAITKAVVSRLDRGIVVPAGVLAACKIAASEFVGDAADKLVQMLGGRGYIETNVAPQIYRDARILRIFEGPTETLAAFLGSVALKSPTILADYLANEGADPSIFVEHLAKLKMLKQYLQSRDQSMSAIDRKLLLREMAGHLTTYALLRCAVSVDSAAWAWLNTQYNLYFSSAVARTRLEISDLACIVAKVDRYSVAIGNNQTTSPGEDHQIDPFVGNKLLFNKLSIGKVC